jgi:predicted nucleotidyltransferase
MGVKTEIKLDSIEESIKANELFLHDRYKVSKLGIFGSFLHGEQK